MANLIIKPTSGGSLVLQDEGGDAALTVGTTGSTTLAGTANNVGTVTGGNYSSTITTSATFPTGHVLQTLSGIYRSEASTNSTSFNAPAGSNFEVTITPASTSNKIWVFTSWEAEHQYANDVACVDFYRSISGGATVQFIAGTSLTGQGMAQIRVNTNSDRGMVSYGFLDSPSTTAAVTYRPSLMRKTGSGNVYIGAGGDGGNTITVQEIKG